MIFHVNSLWKAFGEGTMIFDDIEIGTLVRFKQDDDVGIIVEKHPKEQLNLKEIGRVLATIFL